MSTQRSNIQRPSGSGMTGGPRGGPMAGMGMPVQKAKNFRGTLFRLLGYFKPQTFALVLVLLTSIISTVFNIVGPKVLGLVTTKIFNGVLAKYRHVPGATIDFDYIGKVLLILLGLYVISAIFGYVQQYIMAGVAQRTVYRLRREVDEKLAKVPLKFYDCRTHGEIMSRVVNDMDNISNMLQQSLTQFISSAVTLLGVIVLMLTISPLLAAVVLITFPMSIFVTTVIAKRSQGYFKDQQRSLGMLNSDVEEVYTGHKIVKVFGHESDSLETFNDLNTHLYQAGWRAQFVSGMIMPLMGFIGNIGYVFVAIGGGIMVTQGSITIGDVQAFLQYTPQFTMPITQLASFTNIIQSTMASAERIFELLDEPEESSDPVSAPAIATPRGAVVFQHVNFGYAPDVPLIDDMNIDVKPGQTIAIVGPTGAGKTTLVNLLMRFYDVTSGAILVDGIDIRELKRGDLRHMFGMVLQDTWLFNGTIRDNIAYGREGATEEQIVQAAKAAYADHFIRTLPQNYDTMLSEEASNLSQGQKQLLTIARAILADPAVLILDEATSSVDTRTEINIQRAMLTLMQGRTSFVIAHRLSTIREADLILVMDHGRIIEQGTHMELLECNGFYADLYNSQFAAQGLTEAVV
jgi:ATP-binding cassette, subfamily B, multidrug efflux pump